MNKLTKNILRVLSYGNTEIDLETARKIAELKKLDPIRVLARTADREVFSDGHRVPVRFYFASRQMEQEGENYSGRVLLFIHGGGWVSESVETYDRICMRMSMAANQLVISVDYRRAPEFRFPIPLMDCYAVADALFKGEILERTAPEKITLIGDSAGANLTAALTLLARERGTFMPKRQILIYPAVWNDYSASTPFRSVKENGTDYLLTAEKMEEYLNMYQTSPGDRQSPLLAPLLAEDFKGLPDTLVLTAEFDPLRDEGEAYAEKLRQAGNHVELHRIPDAIHGFFALGANDIHVKESLDYICNFLEED